MHNNLIFIPIIFFTYYFIFKNNKFLFNLVDTDFNKPQGFHKIPTPRIGGLLIILSLITFYLIQNKNYPYDYIFFVFVVINFILGFIDDAKIISNPLKKFFIFISLNIVLIIIFEIKIINFDNNILNYLNNFSNFSAFVLVLFCIFFCVNGSNLIDGFNGLLSIHSLIILITLLLNFDYTGALDLKYFLIIFIISIFCFLILNFPNSKIFLGDSGSYLIGIVIAMTIIKTSNQYNQISAYYFAILIYYIFFEIFFSVFRKILQKKNPFKPDEDHLHMLLYKYLNEKNYNYKSSNYLTSLIINTFYFVSLLPLIKIKNNYLLCEVYFYILFLFYLISYYFLKKLNEKQN